MLKYVLEGFNPEAKRHCGFVCFERSSPFIDSLISTEFVSAPTLHVFRHTLNVGSLQDRLKGKLVNGVSFL